MSFDDIVSVLGRAFGLELKVVQDTTVFADFRPTGEAAEAPSGDFHMMHL